MSGCRLTVAICICTMALHAYRGMAWQLVYGSSQLPFCIWQFGETSVLVSPNHHLLKSPPAVVGGILNTFVLRSHGGSQVQKLNVGLGFLKLPFLQTNAFLKQPFIEITTSWCLSVISIYLHWDRWWQLGPKLMAVIIDSCREWPSHHFHTSMTRYAAGKCTSWNNNMSLPCKQCTLPYKQVKFTLLQKQTCEAPLSVLYCPSCVPPTLVNEDNVHQNEFYSWALFLLCPTCNGCWMVCQKCNLQQKWMTTPEAAHRHHYKKLCPISDSARKRKCQFPCTTDIPSSLT